MSNGDSDFRLTRALHYTDGACRHIIFEVRTVGSQSQSCARVHYSKVRAAREYTIPKSEAIYVNDNQYDVIVDSSRVGVGPLTILLYIYIADSDSPKGVRLQIRRIKTGDIVQLR